MQKKSEDEAKKLSDLQEQLEKEREQQKQLQLKEAKENEQKQKEAIKSVQEETERYMSDKIEKTQAKCAGGTCGNWPTPDSSLSQLSKPSGLKSDIARKI